jgi:hypothetical protein
MRVRDGEHGSRGHYEHVPDGQPGSAEAEVPLVVLDRNERIRLITKFRSLCRCSWQTNDRASKPRLMSRSTVH